MKTKQLLLTLLTFLFPLASWADVWQDPETKVNYTYTVGSTNASVTASGYNQAGSPDVTGDIIIRSKITINGKEYSVTSIGEGAFSGCSSLTSVTIPNSVTSIGASAFYGCSGLTSVEIPNSVTSIGFEAFYDCSDMTSVEIPNSVTNIGEGAFRYCSGLISVEIPNSVTSIGFEAFYNCSGLTSVTIPNGVTSIGRYAFSDCEGLTSVTIGNSVTSIGGGAFSGCSGLTSVTIPNSVTIIGDHAFAGCSDLTSVTIPNSVTSIGGYAFAGCSDLTSVTIPNSVTSLGDYAFNGCSGLTSVTIGNSVTSIGTEAFRDCSGLTSVTIPNSVTSIWARAFYGCISLTSVTIGNSVTSIGKSAFYRCSGMTSVTIGNSVKWIEGDAFRDCSGLTSVTIPNSVTSIGESAFSGCRNLTSVTIPNSVTSIGYGAFSGCFFLNSSFINNSSLTDSNNWGATLVDECTEDGLLIKDNTIVQCRSWAISVTIPNSVTSIEDYAFCDCSSLTSVTIPNSVTSIGYSAFKGCSGLTNVTINCANVGNWFSGLKSIKEIVFGEGVSSIDNSAFSGCSGLTSVTIPNSVTTIGVYAFGRCSGLTSVRIGNSVTSIGDRTFYGCNDLTSVTIGNSVTSIGQQAFYGCSGLTSVTLNCANVGIWFGGLTSIKEIVLGEGVSSIGNSAFSNCIGLTSVTIPNSVTSIGYQAFDGCSGLTSVTIGNGVTSIGQSAFFHCTGLTSVTSEIKEPFAIDNYTFSDDTYNNATLYIPEGTIDAYKATEGWMAFKIIEEVDEVKDATIVLHHDNGTTTIINLTNKDNIRFQDDKIVISSHAVDTEYTKDDVLRITYNNYINLTDVNGDNTTDVADIATIISVMSGVRVAPESAHSADVNSDGAVDVADIATIISAMAGGWSSPTTDVATLAGGTIGEVFYIYRNDGQFNAFFREEIDSIGFSRYDADSLRHNKIASQVVYTPDSTYMIPLVVIDSVGFVTPKTVYKPGVIPLVGDIRNYVVSSDSMTVFFRQDTPVSILPKVGDKLVTEEISDVFRSGFIGQVENVKKIDGMIAVHCSKVDFVDVFEYYYFVTQGDVNASSRRAGDGDRSIINSWERTYCPGTFNFPLTNFITPQIYPAPTGDLAFQFENRQNISFTPTFKVKFVRIVAPKLGTVVSLDISEEDVIKEDVNISGAINWSHDFDAIDIPLVELGIPFLWLYGRAGAFVSASATISMEQHWSQSYRYTFHLEAGSRSFYVPRASINGIRLTNDHGGQAMVKGEASLGIFAELGVEFADRDIASVAYRGEVGVSINGGVMLYKKDIKNALHSTDLYKTLQGDEITLKGFFKTGLPVKLLWFGWPNEHLKKEKEFARVSLVPDFYDTKLERDKDDRSTLFAQTKVKGTCFPVDLGFTLFEKESTEGKTSYVRTGYMGAPADLYSSFFGMPTSKKYEVYPTVKILGVEMLAEPKDDEWGYTSCPDENHPHWIDLGIGTLWRCCNFGASRPEEYGGYYEFGQVASAPTLDQIKVLVNNCSYTWTTNGGKFTGPNGGTIFLPAAGSRWDPGIHLMAPHGNYWSSTPGDDSIAYGLGFDSGGAFWGSGYRDFGFSVRPVR